MPSHLQLTFEFPKSQEYTFDNFIESDGNTLAYKTARSFCLQGSLPCQLLFLYGETGMGKTHLLKAIGNFFYEQLSPANILFVSAVDILERYNQTESYEEVLEVSNRYKEVDLLLLDDIHLIEDSDFVQDQVFHIYNALIDKGKRVAIAGKKSPDRMKKVQSHLQSRLLSGLVTKVGKITDETRGKILHKMALAEGVTLPAHVSNYILTHFDRDIKEFQKFFMVLNAYSLRTRRKISIPLIKEVTGPMKRRTL